MRLSIFITVTLLVTLGCSLKAPNGQNSNAGLNSGGSSGSISGSNSTNTGTSGTSSGQAAVQTSQDKIRYKPQDVLMADYQTALSLDSASLCSEQDGTDCFSEHKVALGALDAYKLGIYQRSDTATGTAAIAVERIALSGCLKRLQLDLNAGASAVLFKGLQFNQNGTLVDPHGSSTKNFITALFQTLIQRNPSSTDTTALLGLYDQIAALNQANPGTVWAWMSCYAVLTSAEAVLR